MRERSFDAAATLARHPNGSRSGSAWNERLRAEVACLLAADDPDHRGQWDELPVPVPPLGLAHVARGEAEVVAPCGHRDRDEVARAALRTDDGGGLVHHVA